MSISTEETVAAAILTAIRSIAKSDLGFDDYEGNTKDYLLEYEQREREAEYLSGRVGGKKEVRCWAVEVLAEEELGSMGNIYRRTYEVTVRGYYAMGSNGAGFRLLREHARKVRAAIRDLGTNLNGLCDRMLGVGKLDIAITDGASADSYMLVGTMTYRWDKLNPDF